MIAGDQAKFNCNSSRWNQAWHFYSVGSRSSPCRIYSYRPHRINASSCQNLSRYTVTWHGELLSLSISNTVTSDAGTYVCGDLLSPTSTCSAVLGVLGMYVNTRNAAIKQRSASGSGRVEGNRPGGTFNQIKSSNIRLISNDKAHY